MTINGKDITLQLQRLVRSGARYRLAVLKFDCQEIAPDALNLGLSVSEAISKMEKKYGQSEAKFQMMVAETVEHIIKESVFDDDELGSVVVLDNPGILFEPELHIDVVGLLRRISKNTLTVLMWAGAMDETALYFLDKSSKHIIKQTDINYTII